MGLSSFSKLQPLGCSSGRNEVCFLLNQTCVNDGVGCWFSSIPGRFNKEGRKEHNLEQQPVMRGMEVHSLDGKRRNDNRSKSEI